MMTHSNLEHEADHDLTKQQCQVCHADAQPYNPQQIKQHLAQLSDWQLIDAEAIPRLFRSYRFKNFVTALAFTNRVGAMAEQQGHHPDLLTRWGGVEVSWWSHSVKGLHRNDFICAAKTEQLYHDHD
jgi:4a-hydroxytetrahydrobiopterin dehydratase